MPATYSLIASNTLASAAATVSFSAIPSSFKDLVLKITARSSRVDWEDQFRIRFSGDTATNYSTTAVLTQGTTASSFRASSTTALDNVTLIASSATSNTFTNTEIYIPNYAGSANKPISISNVAENNSATSLFEVAAFASLWRNSAAVSSITLTTTFSANFVAGSSFFLYGIKNS